MYADDTTLVSHLENFGPVNDINTLEQELNKEILSNKLLLNVAKSKFMIFFRHPRTIPKLNISINGNPVEQAPISVSYASQLTRILHGMIIYQNYL